MTNAPRPEVPSGWCVIEVVDEIDMYSAPALRESLLEAINEGHGHIVLDLTRVTFVDSSGFAVLVSALKRLGQRGGSLRIAGAGSAVRSSMRISGIDRIFGLYPDVGQATADIVSVASVDSSAEG